MLRFTFCLMIPWCIGPVLAQAAQEGAPELRVRVQIETSLGDFVIELDGDRTPMTVLNFAEYVEDGFYNGLIFHRIIEGRLLQGGRYEPDMSERSSGLRDPVVYEGSEELKNRRGTVSAYREVGRTNSAQAEFFINVSDNPALDTNRDGPGYVVMGRVIEGMEVVDQIASVKTGVHERFGAGRLAQVPTDPVVIKSARMLSKINRAQAEAHVEEVRRQAESARLEAETAAVRDLKAQEERIIKETDGPLTVTASGLKYGDKRLGTGLSPTLEDRVEIHFKGMLPDGTVLNDSWGEGDGMPVPRKMTALIKGMQEGLMSMKEGGYRMMIVPSELAFGSEGIPQRIPPHATLVFELELYRVLPP